jgi:tetratricopeptide (TPR) repeat protein
VKAVNLASALISISRFSLATRIIDDIPTEKLSARDRFEIAMLNFVIQNRYGNRTGMEKALAVMKACIEAGGIQAARILNAASQAVVWYMKSKAISKELFNWYVTQGVKLAKYAHGKPPEYINSAALSAWYRAVAMVPAERGDGLQTRDYMKKAKTTAITAIECSNEVYDQHLIKTCYESTMKEYMYVEKDFEKVEENVTALINLDPAWSISYGDLADAYHKFGYLYKAAEWYEKAGRIGPPYVGHHLFSVAMLWEQLGKPQRAFRISIE